MRSLKESILDGSDVITTAATKTTEKLIWLNKCFTSFDEVYDSFCHFFRGTCKRISKVADKYRTFRVHGSNRVVFAERSFDILVDSETKLLVGECCGGVVLQALVKDGADKWRGDSITPDAVYYHKRRWNDIEPYKFSNQFLEWLYTMRDNKAYNGYKRIIGMFEKVTKL